MDYQTLFSNPVPQDITVRPYGVTLASEEVPLILKSRLWNNTVSNIRDWIVTYIDILPKTLRDSHGLLFPKVRYFLTTTFPEITYISRKLTIKLVAYGFLSATIELDEHIITFRDYTYSISPYYECSMHLSPHVAASSALQVTQ